MSIAKKIAHKAEAAKGSAKKAAGRATGSRWNRLPLPRRRPAPQQAAGMNPQSGNGQSAPQTPAGASAPADDSLEGVSQP